MSRTTKNSPASASTPSLADRPLPDPASRRARTLTTLARLGAMTTSRLTMMAGTEHTVSQAKFRAAVLEPMTREGLLERTAVTSGDRWSRTAEGRELGDRLLAAETSAPDPSTVAQPRGIPYSSEPPAPDSYRCPRPGAYDFERCPSRMGSRLSYLDGRQEVMA